MSGQDPRQAPDRRRYSHGQGLPPTGPSSGRPGQPGQEPEKKSRPDSFREWISTGAGVTSAIVALVGLLAGGTAVIVKVVTPPHNPPSGIKTTPGPKPDPSPSHSPSPVNLQSALLSSEALGSAAIVQSTGTNLSQIAAICGGPLSGDTATAYESIVNQQSGTVLSEALISWQSAADAGQAITNNRQAVDQSGSCSVVYSGATGEFTGDDAGSPPSSCESPGQYFATQIEVSSPSSTLPYFGFTVQAQCGTTTISVRVYSDLPGAITQQTADGYLSSAIGKLDS